MKLLIFLLLSSLTAQAVTLEDCHREFARLREERARSTRRFGYALGAATALHASAIAFIPAGEKKQPDLAQQVAEEKKKFEETKTQLKSEAELIAEAKENISSWQSKGKISSPLAEFLIQSEILREPERMQGFRYEELQKFRQEIISAAKEISERDPARFAERISQEVLGKYGKVHCDHSGRFTSYMEDGCGNCSARNKLIISAILDGKVSVPSGYKLAVQNFKNHIEPVLYNPKTQAVIVLSGVRHLKEPAADLYEPTHIHCAYLRGREADEEDCLKKTLLVKAKNPEQGKDKRVDPTTDDPMDFGDSAAVFDSSDSFAKLLAGLNIPRTDYTDFEVECSRLPQGLSIPKVDLYSTYWRDQNDEMPLGKGGRGSSVRVRDGKLCDDLKKMDIGERLQKLSVIATEELSKRLADPFIANFERKLKAVAKDPSRASELAEFAHDASMIENLHVHNNLIRRFLGLPREESPKIKYMRLLHKEFLRDVEANAYDWLKYFSKTGDPTDYKLVSGYGYNLYVASPDTYLKHDRKTIHDALKKEFANPRVVHLAPEISAVKEAQREELESRPEGLFYAPDGRVKTMTIKLQPMTQQEREARKIANDGMKMKLAPIYFERETFKKILNVTVTDEGFYYDRFDKELLDAMKLDPDFWGVSISGEYFLRNDKYIKFINNPVNYQRLGFSKFVTMEYLDIYDFNARQKGIKDPVKYGPIPVELAEAIANSFAQQNKDFQMTNPANPVPRIRYRILEK